MSRMIRFAALFPLLVPFPAGAAVTCDRCAQGSWAEPRGRQLLREYGSHHRQHDDTSTSTTPANNSLPGLPVFAFTPFTDRAVIAPSVGQAHADHKGRAGPAAQRPHRLRPAGPGAVPSAAAEQLERAPGGRGRVGNAQRVQRRFRVERLRRAERLRLRVAEQGRVKLILRRRSHPRIHWRAGSTRLPPRSCISSTTIPASLSRAGPNSWSRRRNSRATG